MNKTSLSKTEYYTNLELIQCAWIVKYHGRLDKDFEGSCLGIKFHLPGVKLHQNTDLILTSLLGLNVSKFLIF